MSLLEILLLAAALSMDAFAVSISYGMRERSAPWKRAAILGAFFGFFQFIMPLIGWSISRFAQEYIRDYDHWIAFLMLAGIGVKMTWEAAKHDVNDDDCLKCGRNIIRFRLLLWLSIATSIDALAAGVSFVVYAGHVVVPCAIIGLTTFAFSFCGMMCGAKIGRLAGKKFEFLGGVVIICIGIKILIEHIFFHTA